jgi:hypothetical protein
MLHRAVAQRHQQARFCCADVVHGAVRDQLDLDLSGVKIISGSADLAQAFGGFRVSRRIRKLPVNGPILMWHPTGAPSSVVRQGDGATGSPARSSGERKKFGELL